MSTNYLIGIGGTGARVVEAVVHACAAGLGPDELNIFLIDPDDSNGNLSRTKTLVSDYQRGRKAFTQRNDEDRVRLFHTRIETPDPFVWSIFSARDTTLATYVDLDNLRERADQRALADFISVLFTGAELETVLNEGFRGHPSIGAVVMATHDPGQEPWKSFWDDVKQCQGPHEAKVFLVGSIFGGTGAAGIPTFAAPEMIKFKPDANVGDGSSKVLLGGALVLPYFTFESPETPPITADGRQEMFVTPADFPIATQAALQFYHEKKLGFDEVYFIGDSLAQRVGKFSHGSLRQDNRAHYIELVSALAAFDFFSQPHDPAVADPKYFYGCREARVVDWKALLTNRDANKVAERQNEVKLALCTMTAFAYMLATEGEAVLAAPHGEVLDAWYKSNFRLDPRRAEDAGRNPREAKQRASIEMVEIFGRKFLAWIASLDEDSGEVRLIDRHKLFADTGEPDENGAARLLAPREHEAVIGEFVKGTQRGKRLEDFLRILREVQVEASSMSPANRWINLFYEAAREFCATAYNIPLPIRPR
ncbi:MAG TPA: hypothetical protein VGO40_07535 [Longimicrobium sp.]|nr:hypothetical protein [Longimicrobium sp.]